MLELQRILGYSCAFVGAVVLLVAGWAHPRSEDRMPDWPRAITYEIFVQSFADTNNDGIGDLDGVTMHLDSLQRMGVKAIWLMPIHPSPSYHKYDVTDYRAIHPDYGTMEDFEELVRAAHAKGIKVIIDLVINHTARTHPWFRKALADTTSRYHDYYVWKDSSQITDATVEETGPDTDNVQRWHPIAGRSERYYAYFWGGMPDLNFDNPAVRKEILDIGRFWLKKGVDGFRLDAAKHIYIDHQKNHAWWQTFRKEMQDVEPNVLLIGEVWDRAEIVQPYLKGLDALFNFDMAAAMLNAVKTGDGDSLAYRHKQVREKYQAVAPDFIDATFLANHDQNRVRSVLNGDRKAKMAANLLFTLPGAPFVYYGEEIGMRGMKPDPHIREPYLWQETPGAPYRTTWIDPKYSTDSTVVPRARQAARDTSMLHHYTEMMALRNDSPALTMGRMQPVMLPNEHLTAFVRLHPEEHLLVVHNVADRAVSAPMPDSLRRYTTELFTSNAAAEVMPEGVTLPPYSTVIMRAPDK
ncbi:alpha-amylase family glycosyl hydrolase [Salisaeta longa]|uniref:alpha-amylase family glycosyl hydrolase n=1 Tax=Salisaeta longa TaxID=503170 RepID=UPI0003B4144C|nr:alpha-amylase family glycosyl hydrolase [Salisaeta longa]